MKKKYDEPVTNANEYIAQQPVEYRQQLVDLRDLIKTIVPEAEETISYQVICFKLFYMLVGIGTAKGYCSLYTMSPGLVKLMKAELKNVKLSGATIHFVPNEPLPVELIKKIVKERIKENKAKSSVRTVR